MKLLEKINEILSKYEFANIEKVEKMETSGNIAYIVTADNQKYVLRLCPKDNPWRYRTCNEIEAELELIEHLQKNDIPVPRPIATKNGDTIVGFDNIFGYLKIYDDGQPDINPSTDKIKIFGETIGKMHRATENFKTKQERKHTYDLQDTLDYINKEGKRLLKEFAERLKKQLSAIQFPTNLPKGIIHEDLGKRHVLWKGNKISCILDFDRCYYGFLLLDLGQAIRGWCFPDWKKFSKENFENLIQGYESQRKLNSLEKQYLENAVKFAFLERSMSYASQKDMNFAENQLKFAESLHMPDHW